MGSRDPGRGEGESAKLNYDMLDYFITVCGLVKMFPRNPKPGPT